MTKDRRFLVPFVLCALPATAVLGAGVYFAAEPQSWNAMLHPLGVLGAVVALLIVALPLRLAIYTYSLRDSSPMRSKVWAAIQCGVPSLGVFVLVPDVLERRISAGKILLLSFFGCYLAALVILLLHIVRAARTKNA